MDGDTKCLRCAAVGWRVVARGALTKLSQSPSVTCSKGMDRLQGEQLVRLEQHETVVARDRVVECNGETHQEPGPDTPFEN